MSMQIQIQKSLSQVNFLMSSVYEKHDLTNQIKLGDRFLVRQGDLIVTNYEVNSYRKRGLRKALLEDRNGILNFANSHFIVPFYDKTLLIHNEHGLIVIPERFERLNFYTINYAVD